jgi:hypothetical protein
VNRKELLKTLIYQKISKTRPLTENYFLIEDRLPESRKSEFTSSSDKFLNTESQTRIMASRMYHAHKQTKQISKMI